MNSFLTREDAESMQVPHILLASADEPKDMVAAYEEVLSGDEKKCEVETYSTSHHGWMGARARLAEEENRKEYERGYVRHEKRTRQMSLCEFEDTLTIG